MQSFLQYRQFGKAVETQYEHHRQKLALRLARHGTSQSKSRRSSDTSSLSSSSSKDAFSFPPSSKSSTSLDTPDLENGSDEELSSDPNSFENLDFVLPPGVHLATTAELQETDDIDELRTQTQHSRIQENYTNEPIPIPPTPQNTLTATPTQGTTSLGHTLTGIHARDRTTKEGNKGTIVFVVSYHGPLDPLNPHNWPHSTRLFCTATIASIAFIVGFASSVDSAALPQASATFGVSPVVESLATGLYLVGFGCGALFAGPVSETLGRNPVYIGTMAAYALFIMASGVAPSIASQLVFRFLAGFFGSTPLVCAGGSISDLWSPLERVVAFPAFATAGFMGPVLGPVVGGFIAESTALGNWRWTEWVTLIISGIILAMLVLFQPETYPNTLLRWRAKHFRRVTGDDRFRAGVEVRKQGFLHRLRKALYRPFLLTFTEPIIGLIALYLTVIYIVLFTFLDGYTYIFQETYAVSQGITGLCFLGIALGLVLASTLVPLMLHWAKRDLKKIKERGGYQLPPEFRLWYAMLGGSWAIPISLFWMGWTAYPWISIWSPLAASVLFGYGTLCVFISSYQYIIDSYEIYAASALVSVTLIRYSAAGGMTIVGIPFYQNMGVHWTCTILGCISALMAPLPYVFYKFGKSIRSKSKYAVNVS